jgi:hypothetical protein
MSEQVVHGPGAAGADAPPTASTRTEPRSMWAGWMVFGGAMLVMLGFFNAIEGLTALFNDEYYLRSPQGLLVFDITGWGWVHLIVGVLAVVVGLGVFTGAGWARVCGAILCGFNALTQLVFLSAYPVWGILVIALDVLVIWALIVHGDEARDKDW